MSQGVERRAAQLTTAGVFLVPALALLFPSGYSVGTVLLLLASLLNIGAWHRCRPSREMRWSCQSFLPRTSVTAACANSSCLAAILDCMVCVAATRLRKNVT